MKTTIKTQLATLALLSLAATSLAQPQYAIEDLGAVNGDSEAFAINNYNEVVGWSFLNNGARGAMLWSNGTMQVINNTTSNAAAYAINDDGEIVGRRGTRPVHFTAPNMFRDLGTFGGPEGTAFGINDMGRVAGAAQMTDGNWRAFSGRYDIVQALKNHGTLGGLTSIGRDVNNVNCVTGWASTGGPNKACIFSPSGPTQNLGTLGGPQSAGNAISDYFGVAGWSDLNRRHNTPTNQSWVRHAMLWTPESGRKDLGDPYSAGKIMKTDAFGRKYFTMTLREGEFMRTVNVYGVDTYGQGVSKSNVVCGYARLYLGPIPRTVDRAIVWISNKMYDLNDLLGANGFEWNLDHAWGINDGLTIVGRGYNYTTGAFRAFKATKM